MDEELQSKIRDKTARVVVVGLGYVGLPTAVEIAQRGYPIIGFDINKQKVEQLGQGVSGISDVTNEQLANALHTQKFSVTSDGSCLASADIVLIAVPTPLDRHKLPDLSAVESAADAVAAHFHPGELILMESSTYPGTTREIILPRLEKVGGVVGRNFLLAFSPERIDPGNKVFPFRNIPRVVGGMTEKCTEVAALFYESVLDAPVKRVSSPEVAEMSKILENTFRLVNISLVNELGLLSGKLGIDIWEVIEAASTKPYGFMPFYPSPKIGGHCIPLDPFYLSYKAREYNFWARFIELAGEINEQMPHQLVTRVIWALNQQEKPVRNSRILIWGVSYKKDIGDTRESAAYDVIGDLLRKGARVEYFDPHVPQIKVDSRVFRSISYTHPEALKEYDLVVILTDHSLFDYEEVAKHALFVVDARNAIRSRAHKNVSWF